MASYDSEVVIAELTGQKRSVTLRGGGLPFRGAPFAQNQRLVTTWYPGNATEASQSVLGPTLKPSTWTGEWHTTHLYRTPSIFDDGKGSKTNILVAWVLRDLLDDIFQSGQRLRVTWRNQIGDRPEQVIVREGRAGDWEFTPDRSDDIPWSITFEWLGRGGSQQKGASKRSENVGPDLQKLIAKTQQIANGLAASLKAHNSLNQLGTSFTLDDIQNLLNGPQEILGSFTRTAQNIVSRLSSIGSMIDQVRSMPSELLGQLLDVANGAVSAANNFVDEMSRKSPEQLAESQKAGQLADATNYYSGATTQADLMKNAAMGLRTLVVSADSQQRTILAVHVVRGTVVQPVNGVMASGEILGSISSLYYGTPDQSATIAKANRLPLNQQFVERGAVLIIPTLDTSQTFDPSGG